ncbi:MAG: serine/threonine-protein kinase [Nannocystaceae bacterium]
MIEAANQTTAESLPWELADRLVQARVEAQLLGESATPMTLGRYQVERGLGAGAMGRLLLAFDPDLQRRVALKLITPAQVGSPEARQRFAREARAMAQLSDPHVAQVYEVGEADGQLFVAIEYIDGRDLREWLDQNPLGDGGRPWVEVLEVFRQAGAGLAAAHDKGITHRDFKPDNVMLEHDGRARVVDFGLALPGSSGSTATLEGPRNPEDGAVELTQTGTVVGTPAYLSPEQGDGAPADPRSDQFSYCVALFEALTGGRPFVGDTVEQVRRSQQGEMAPWSGPAPRWVSRVLRRGLALDPAARWPDMRTLLQALDPARRRRRWITAGVLVVLASSVGWAVRPTADPCAEAGAAIDGTWDRQQRDAVLAAAGRADAAWGPMTAERLVARLDAHANSWRAAARGMCRASVPEPADSAGRGCLEESRRRLASAATEAISGEPALLVSAVARAELLPDPRACAEAPPSVYDHGSPDTSGARELLAAGERAMGAMSVREQARSVVESTAAARATADEAVAAAEAEDDEPLLARALWLAGRVLLRDAEAKAAERQLRRGLALAERVDDAPLAAAITTELVYAVGRDRERAREAEDLADAAAGMIAALGDPPLLDARLRSHRASAIAHARDGDHDHAVRLHEQSVALLVDTLGSPHPMTIAATGNLGAALNYAGRPSQAEARLLEAIAAARAAWGDDHPRTALLLGTLGLARLRQGDLEGAQQHLRRSYEIRLDTLGSRHAQVDEARYNLASALRRGGDHAQALPLLEAGLAHTLHRLGPDDARLGPWWVATGESRLELADHPGAREALTAAVRVFERTGASAADYGRVRLALARAWALTDPQRARALAQQAHHDAREAESAGRQSEIEAFLATL